VLFGLLFFGEHPPMRTLAGAGVIIVTTLFINWREHRNALPAADKSLSG
jgi:drug/metabolite transporter (DMT)-like permease